MKIMKTALLVGAVLFFVAESRADIELSGFVDLSYRDAQGENSSFGIGPFEIDIASELSDRVSFEGAVVFEGREATLGQTLLDVKLLRKDAMSLQMGLIDIPFGIDYRFFASPDRKLASPPLTTELMMDGGWSDIGVNLHGSLSCLNYNIYAVNGMGGTSSTDIANQDEDNNNGRTLGCRIGIVPKEGIEAGVSYSRGPYLDNNTKESISRAGCDFQVGLGRIKTKGEYIWDKIEVPGASAIEHSGYYLQLLVQATEKVYGVVRYGLWKPKAENEITRLTLGCGYELEENVSLSFEYQINDEKPKVDNNLILSRVVVSF